MAQIKGKLILCSGKNCSNTAFVKFTGEGDTDGGYTKFDTYENLPDGWENYTGIGDLCPECATKLKMFIKDLVGDDVAPIYKIGGR